MRDGPARSVCHRYFRLLDTCDPTVLFGDIILYIICLLLFLFFITLLLFILTHTYLLLFDFILIHFNQNNKVTIQNTTFYFPSYTNLAKVANSWLLRLSFC